MGSLEAEAGSARLSKDDRLQHRHRLEGSTGNAEEGGGPNDTKDGTLLSTFIGDL